MKSIKKTFKTFLKGDFFFISYFRFLFAVELCVSELLAKEREHNAKQKKELRAGLKS